jgi:hypothetical protein
LRSFGFKVGWRIFKPGTINQKPETIKKNPLYGFIYTDYQEEKVL